MRGLIELVPRIDALTVSGNALSGMARASGASLIGNHSQLILWQYSANEPLAPPAPYDVDSDTFASGYGAWNLSEAAALALRTDVSHPLWVAYGGTDNIAPDSIGNREWSCVFAVAAQQYSADRGGSWHYPIEDDDNTYRYLKPDGTWSPAIALGDDPFGYIELVSDVDAFSDHDNSNRYHAVSPGLRRDELRRDADHRHRVRQLRQRWKPG